MRHLWLLLLVLASCPERRAVDRGTELTYRYASDRDGGIDTTRARLVAERRLARAKVAARLDVDDGQLRLRVPEGSDVAAAKEAFASGSVVEVCLEDTKRSEVLCSLGQATPRVLPFGCTVRLAAPTLTLPSDAGVQLAFERVSDGFRGYAISNCMELEVQQAKANGTSVTVKLSHAAAARFERLTSSHIGERLLVRVDGAIVAAPVVETAITGDALQIAVDDSANFVQRLAPWAIPQLALEREQLYGR